jgi:lysophospholipase L1-like esterase
LKPHPEMFRDGVHPTAEGAAIIAQTVQETLESAAAPK